ncbi:MAG TPA: UDP-forming cellulose synthase catalytic subunit [Paucimonas sp.]|nr:UDP-forming cellulose synthase catalytic subunit [Paucimonas sp.]
MRSLPLKLDWRCRAWQLPTAVVLGAALVYSIHFSGSYFSFAHQIGLGWACLFSLYFLYKFSFAERQPWRLLFILLAAFLAMRYLLWRTFDTLVYVGPFDFLAMIVLYAAEVYAIAIFFMGLFINAWPLVRRPLPLSGDPQRLPSVDVLIPTYNEPDDIVLATATAATQIDYPKEKLHIYIIDDGGTEKKRNHPTNGMAAWERHYRMRRMAESLGIGYLTRETNQHAKAGNINHALHYTSGDLILVLDCDHVPTHDFLKNTVGHFIADPKLFLVQTPHFFINPCPVEKNLEGFANPSGENDMFYRTIHPAMDAWNASYFCGSAAVLRRKCLEEIGGICGNTITEDAETAFTLHSHGYNSIYINRPMVCGLSPESFDDYVIQRSRWAQGMTQLVLLNNPLKTPGLSLPQRISYFNSSFFWLFGFARFIYFVAPACYLLFGLNIYDASWLQILAYALPFVLSTFIVMNCFYKGTRQPFFSEIYESVQSMFLIPAVISVLLHPRKPSFKVTPKGLMNERNQLSPMSAPFFLVILVNILALVMAGISWVREPILRDVIAVTGAWCVYNLYLALVSLGAFWERRQIRKFHRINASGPISVRFPRMNTTANGWVKDVSLSGIGFEIRETFPIKPQERVILTVKDSYGKEYRFESRIQRTIRKGDKTFCGGEFVESLVSYPNVVSFVFGDSQRWVDNWAQKSRSRGSARMLWYFLKMGVKGVVECTYSMLKQALIALWKLFVKWFATTYLRDRIIAVCCWLGYRFYLAFVWMVEQYERRHARKFHRIDATGTATVDFPLHNAHLIGRLSDVSLTGLGVVLDVPFKLKDDEPVIIDVLDKDGHAHHLDCTIKRAIARDGHLLCGAEFNIDMHSFPEIVQYVYGESLKDLVLHAVWEPKHG